MISRLEQLCLDKGLKMTEQRRVIARVLSESADHPDVEQVYRRATAIDARISIATVYRTVRLFEEASILARHDFGDGRSRYEEMPSAHHDHLIDLQSGRVIEFRNEEIERLQEIVADQLGYELVGHRLERVLRGADVAHPHVEDPVEGGDVGEALPVGGDAGLDLLGVPEEDLPGDEGDRGDGGDGVGSHGPRPTTPPPPRKPGELGFGDTGPGKYILTMLRNGSVVMGECDTAKARLATALATPGDPLRRQAENRVMQAPAAAPVDQAGAGFIGRAAQEKSTADAFRLDAVVVTGTATASELDEMRRARAGINPTQRIGGRLFIMRDSTWTDLGHGDSLHVVSIAPYSEAYFALLKLLPDLREAAALEPAVLVAGRHASIKIGAGGKTRWNPGELERLVREFRG